MSQAPGSSRPAVELRASAVHKDSVWPTPGAVGLVLRVVSKGEVVHHKAGELPVVAAVALNDVVFERRKGHTALGALGEEEEERG